MNLSEDSPLNPEATEFCPRCRGAGRCFSYWTKEYVECSVCDGYGWVPARYYQELKER